MKSTAYLNRALILTALGLWRQLRGTWQHQVAMLTCVLTPVSRHSTVQSVSVSTSLTNIRLPDSVGNVQVALSATL